MHLVISREPLNAGHQVMDNQQLYQRLLIQTKTDKTSLCQRQGLKPLAI